MHAQVIEIIMNLRQNVIALMQVTKILRGFNEIMRLSTSFLSRVINENCIGLVPSTALVVPRMASSNLPIIPDLAQPLIALRSQIVILLAQTESISSPYCSDLLPNIRCKNGVAHGINICGLSRRPNNNCECIDAVFEEGLGVGSHAEIGGVQLVGSVEESAVEIDDNE